MRAIVRFAFSGITVFGASVFLLRTAAVEAQEIREKGAVVHGPKTRGQFARAMAKVKEGMSDKDVTALLGKPDDIRTQTDPGGISTTRTREVWRYGTDGHLTFPTLGCVYIDKDRKVQYVYGGRGRPPDLKVLPEKQLRSLLHLIDKAPSYNSGYHYDPLLIIRIVNVLQPLGKEKALAAIQEYLRVASSFHAPGREGVFLVLRVLFDIPADPGHMPNMSVGACSPAAPKNPKQLPRFPILIQDDVPLLLVSGYALIGHAERPESHLIYFREKGRLRGKPLRPGNTPLRILTAWAKNAGWLYGKDDIESGKLLIANQLLNMLDSIYRSDTDSDGYKFWPEGDVDKEWKSVEAKVGKLDIRWNPEKQRYTFKDGSHLPGTIQKLYRRHIWKLDGLNGEAKLIVERLNKKYISVSLQWSGKKGQKMPPFTLSVFAVSNKAKALAELKQSSISALGGAEAFSSQSFQAELAEGTEIQARLLIRKREQVSPVYTP
jgi:hypothetical protein